MITPTLNAGENPAEDAAAAEHVRMLLSTGMAYEFQPETIATRAFLDGFALGAADLASVTAERDKAHRIVAEIKDRVLGDEDFDGDAIVALAEIVVGPFSESATPVKHPDTVPARIVRVLGEALREANGSFHGSPKSQYRIDCALKEYDAAMKGGAK